jgi:hypothetical protein
MTCKLVEFPCSLHLATCWHSINTYSKHSILHIRTATLYKMKLSYMNYWLRTSSVENVCCSATIFNCLCSLLKERYLNIRLLLLCSNRLLKIFICNFIIWFSRIIFILMLSSLESQFQYFPDIELFLKGLSCSLGGGERILIEFSQFCLASHLQNC